VAERLLAEQIVITSLCADLLEAFLACTERYLAAAALYGRADGMPSFQLTVAVRDKIVVSSEYNPLRHG
jgi:hypothetical protein